MAPTSEESTRENALQYSEQEDLVCTVERSLVITEQTEDSLQVVTLKNITEQTGDSLQVVTLQDYQEIGETEETREKGESRLRVWIQNHESIVNCRQDTSFVRRFLRMQKHQVEKSCNTLENYLRMRKNHPQWFQNLDVRDEKVQELVRSGYVFCLPERDSEGRRVIFSKARVLDPSRHTNSDAMRAHIITFEALLESEEVQLKGLTYIFDCSGLSLAQLSIWSPAEVTKLFKICEKNLPMRHKDINLLSLPFPLRWVLEFAKSLLSEKIKSRICLLSSVDKLHSKFGTACTILPEEYGGSVPLQEMTDAWVKHLDNLRPSLLSLDSMEITEKTVKCKEEKSSIFSYLPSFVGWSSASSSSV